MRPATCLVVAIQTTVIKSQHQSTTWVDVYLVDTRTKSPLRLNRTQKLQSSSAFVHVSYFLVSKRASMRGSQVPIAICRGFKHCLADVAVVGSTRCTNHMVATPVFLIEGVTALALSSMQTYPVRAELVGVQSCFLPETVEEIHHKLDWSRGLLLKNFIVQTAWKFNRVLKRRDSP